MASLPPEMVAVPLDTRKSDFDGKPNPGKAVKDGRIRFLSVSQIVQFDPRQKGGCPKRWAWVKLFGKSEERTVEADRGNDHAKSLEVYLKTGYDTLVPELRAGKHLLPKPGPDLEVEEPLGDIVVAAGLRDSGGSVDGIQAAAGLIACGIPLMGAADYRHFRGEYVDETRGLLREAPGHVVGEIGDHKTIGRIRDHVSRGNRVYKGWAKTAEEIAEHPQWLGYGAHAAYRHPELTHIRLSANYYQMKHGYAASKVTILLSADEVRVRWRDLVEPVVREMVDVAKIKDPDEAPVNIASCEAFPGRPCAHASYCNRPKGDVFDLLQIKKSEEVTMGFEDLFATTPATPSNGVSTPVAPQIPQVPPQSDAERAATIAAEKQRLLGTQFGYCADCGEALRSENSSRLQNGKIKHIGCANGQKASDPPLVGGVPSIGAVNPADGPAPDILRDAAPLPQSVIDGIEDSELKKRAQLHADAAHAKAAAEEAKKPAADKKGGRCPNSGARQLMTKEEMFSRKTKCNECGKEYKAKNDQVVVEVNDVFFVVPGHNLPKEETASASPPSIPDVPVAAATTQAPAVPELPIEAPSLASASLEPQKVREVYGDRTAALARKLIAVLQEFVEEK